MVVSEVVIGQITQPASKASLISLTTVAVPNEPGTFKWLGNFPKVQCTGISLDRGDLLQEELQSGWMVGENR